MLKRRFNATVEIRTKNSTVIYSALKPDINHSVEGRTKAEMKLIGDTITIDIDSDDLSHLRASLNSYLRLAKSAISCLDATAL
jgi:tRNA threonylcarbamoyladenosine modification (KEOPS) complex  Pcc1 subunit